MVRARRRLHIDWLLVIAQLAAVMVIFGVPDLGAARDLLTSGYPTTATTAAAIAVVLWIAAIALVIALAVLDLRRTVPRSDRRSRAAALVVLLGLTCLAGGIARHQASVFHPCCGSLVRAESTLGGSP